MHTICQKNKCTGCGACAATCGKKAIAMLPDDCGYVYPVINQSLCSDCGLCREVCPSIHWALLHYPLENLAMTEKEDLEILSCASGGAATALGRTVIKNGGVVYGCDGTDIRDVHHTRVTDLENLERLKGSKYVQSDLRNTFRLIKNDLKEELQVLFIGTPCQVAGLLGYIPHKLRQNLFTIDLVCHGVPSQKMLNDNIDEYTENKTETCKVSFREKQKIRNTSICNPMHRITYGWFFQNQPYGKKICKPFHKDPYMLGFISGLTFRVNCYECRYACIARCADLTLSDYWGLPENTSFDKGKGVSNILVNTEQGQMLWNLTAPYVSSEQRDIIESLRGNGQLQAPSAPHPLHEKFVELYPRIGFAKAVKICSRRYLMKFHIKNIMQKVFRK